MLDPSAKSFLPGPGPAQSPQQGYFEQVQGQHGQGHQGPYGNAFGQPPPNPQQVTFSPDTYMGNAGGYGGGGYGGGYGRGGGMRGGGGGRGGGMRRPMMGAPMMGGGAPLGAKLFVGQLPFEWTLDDMHRLFGAYGNVVEIHMLKDGTGKPRGSAFVTYEKTCEADAAVFTLHNNFRLLSNRPMQVSYAKNSPNISPYGRLKAIEVHNDNQSNPLPDGVM